MGDASGLSPSQPSHRSALGGVCPRAQGNCGATGPMLAAKRPMRRAVLASPGAAGLARIGPITWVILALLAILFLSYWQTIAAYPNNGGSYVVAKENLGTNAGLLAAAALMLDYLLNVAVGISAGVGAL